MSQGFTNQQTYAVLPPTVQKFTSGSGTYTLPSGVKYIQVLMCGGGGGGGGSGNNNNGTTGGTGGTSTFGSSLLTCTGGVGGAGTTGTSGGAGGTFTLNSPAIGFGCIGSTGNASLEGEGVLTTFLFTGGAGGQSAFFGGNAGATALGNVVGISAAANSGSGGAGASNPGGANSQTGRGGGAGACINAFITSPSSTYSYNVGAAGTAGTAGPGGQAGGAGGSGIIIVLEYYDLIGIPTNLTLPIPVNQGGTGVTNSNWTAGSLTFSPTTQGIVGTTTNDNAAAGYVGEYVSSNVPQSSGVSITSNTDTNITTISLTAGDWDVNGNVYLEPTNIATFSAGKIWTSTTSATKPNDSSVTGILGSTSIFFNAMSFSAPTIRVSIASTTTVYLSARATFSAGTMTGYGNLVARRRR